MGRDQEDFGKSFRRGNCVQIRLYEIYFVKENLGGNKVHVYEVKKPRGSWERTLAEKSSKGHSFEWVSTLSFCISHLEPQGQFESRWGK